MSAQLHEAPHVAVGRCPRVRISGIRFVGDAVYIAQFYAGLQLQKVLPADLADVHSQPPTHLQIDTQAIAHLFWNQERPTGIGESGVPPDFVVEVVEHLHAATHHLHQLGGGIVLAHDRRGATGSARSKKLLLDEDHGTGASFYEVVCGGGAVDTGADNNSVGSLHRCLLLV